MSDRIRYPLGAMAGCDDLGRVCPEKGAKKEREVGLFYFLWLGYHHSHAVYDNSKVLAKDPGAPVSKKRWTAAGGHPDFGYMHWWGEPLFHYYSAQDKYVVRKHMRMFIDMGIDFLMLDTTNAQWYPEACFALFDTLDEFCRDGWNVPHVGFYTFTNTAATLQDIMENFFLKHPEYSHLWYCRGGKPFAVGDLEDKAISPEVKAFFHLDDAYMDFNKYRTYTSPSTFTFDMTANRRIFPWIDFADEPEMILDENGDPKMMTISVAEICETTNSTYSYLWNTLNHTRSWDGKTNRNFLPGEEDAWKYGYNFGREMECVLKADPPMVFICGWNEWLAGNWQSERGWAPDNALGKYTKDPGDMCMFVDQFNINNNRDTEPMRGGYGDLYTMQMAAFIRRYKGVEEALPLKKDEMDGEWPKWEKVSYRYRHPVVGGEGQDRALYANWENIDPARQHFEDAPAALRGVAASRGENDLYLRVETKGALPAMDKEGRMTLFMRVSPEGDKWNGFDLAWHRKGTDMLEKYQNGTWRNVAALKAQADENGLSVAVPLSLLGENVRRVEFKWADAWKENDGVWTFYTDGDCAPYGRFNYVLSL